MNNDKIHVNQVVLTRPFHFLAFPFLAILVDQINMLNNPLRSPVADIRNRGFFDYLRFLTGNLYFFEIISFVVFSFMLGQYYRVFKLDTVGLKVKSLLIYQLKWIPLFISTIFIFGPITNFARYLVVYYPTQGWSRYFPEFFFTTSMFNNYLFPIILWGAIIVNINLLQSYLSLHKKNQMPILDSPVVLALYMATIEVHDNRGSTTLNTEDIMYFEVEAKSYYAVQIDSRKAVRKTISELENDLDPSQFFRINRSQIINIAFVESYTYWEFEKYIIRLLGVDREFIITRKKYKLFKSLLANNKS